MSEPSIDGPAVTFRRYLATRALEFDRIDTARRGELDDLATIVAESLAQRDVVPMTFICTHNSRRSHLGQIWAKLSADRFELDGIETYSGGTEVTAFEPRAVDAIRRAGLDVSPDDDAATNPRYAVTAPGRDAMTCWSKTYDDAANPSADFIAVMTCSSADEACPIVAGASHRVSLTYEDPKAFDGTDREREAYDERCAQIAREMLYLFTAVSTSRTIAQ